MPFEDLREFLHALEKRGELKRVALAADPYLEIAAFADRSVKTGGPALLFENPTVPMSRSSSMPSRVFAACKSPWAWTTSKTSPAASPASSSSKSRGPSRKAQAASEARRSQRGISENRFRRTLQRSNPPQRLFPRRIPHPARWPGDAGRFITLPLVFSRDPKRASVIAACTACKCSTARHRHALAETQARAPITIDASPPKATRPACPSPSPLAPIPPPSFPPFFRCRPRSTKCSSPASSATRPSKW